ncbi:protein kinase domain-containing protein [Streptomyces nodosus]
MEKLHAGDPQGVLPGVELRGRAGAYRLLTRLGAGGMGNVYLARSDRGRTVAVKLVRRELAEQEEFRARFRQEVQAARQVGGYWTAPVLDADTEAEIPWVATGYVAGPSLQTVVSRDYGALPERSVRILAAGLAHALRDIHAAGLIHRDLKPSNVLVTIDGPRVIDFGIVRALETVTEAGLTQTGALVGSPGFMAPEQVRGDRVTPACDVFCLGSVLAYAATGTVPFGPANSAAHALMFRIAQEEPDLEGLPESLADLVRDCLRKDPAARPAPAEILERTGVEDTVTGGRSRDPWLPGALVAQLGRHAVRLLDSEDPEQGAAAAVPAGPARPADADADAEGRPNPTAPTIPAARTAPTIPAAPGDAVVPPVSVAPEVPAVPEGAAEARPGADGAEEAAVGGGTPGEAAAAPSVSGATGTRVDLVKRAPAAPVAEAPPEHAPAPDTPDGAAPPPSGPPLDPGRPPAQAVGPGPAPLPGVPPHPAYGSPQQHPQHPAYGPPSYPGGSTAPYGPYPYGPHPFGDPARQEPPRRSGRSTAVLIAVALVVALGAGGSVYTLMQGDDPGTGGRARPGPSHPAGPAASAATTPPPAASPTASPSPSSSASAAGAVPDGYLGTWNAAIDNGSGHNTRRLVVQQGEAGDTVLSLTADGPSGGGTYHCVFHAELTGRPTGEGPLEIGPSTVTEGSPLSSCTPGGATELTLLPDGRLRRLNPATGESLTYTKEN